MHASLKAQRVPLGRGAPCTCMAPCPGLPGGGSHGLGCCPCRPLAMPRPTWNVSAWRRTAGTCRFVPRPCPVHLDNLRRLDALVALGRRTGLRLNLTGLAHYRREETPRGCRTRTTMLGWSKRHSFGARWRHATAASPRSRDLLLRCAQWAAHRPGGHAEAGDAPMPSVIRTARALSRRAASARCGCMSAVRARALWPSCTTSMALSRSSRRRGLTTRVWANRGRTFTGLPSAAPSAGSATSSSSGTPWPRCGRGAWWRPSARWTQATLSRSA